MLCPALNLGWEGNVTRFDLMPLGSIALLALAIYTAYRCWDEKQMVLSLALLAASLAQVGLLLHLVEPWAALDMAAWTTLLAGMILCLALGLLNMDLVGDTPSTGYTRPATFLILIISLAQLLVGVGFIQV